MQIKYKETKVIDIASRIKFKNIHIRNLLRFFEYISIISRFIFVVLMGANFVYITIAQSRLGFWRDYIFVSLSSMLRIPVVVHLKGGNYDGFFNNANKAEQYFIKSMLPKVESIIVLSDKLMDMFDFDQSLLKKIKVVKNGFVGLNQLDPPVIEKAAPLHIIFLSNLIRSKGYLELIDAVNITDKGKKIKLTLAGELMQSVDDNNGPLIDIPRTKEICCVTSGMDIIYLTLVRLRVMKSGTY